MIVFLQGSRWTILSGRIIVVKCDTASIWWLPHGGTWQLELLWNSTNTTYNGILFSVLVIYIYFLQDRTSPIQSYGPSGSIDWATAAQSSSSVARSSHYYSSSLPSHPTSGYSPYSGWDSAPQTAYSPYNVPPSHCKSALNFCEQYSSNSRPFLLYQTSFCHFAITSHKILMHKTPL